MNNKTSIVSTLGPASSSLDTITRLLAAGVSTFRLNFSHGSFEEHLSVLQHINTARAKLPYAISVMGDLCGPKIRIGTIEPGTEEMLNTLPPRLLIWLKTYRLVIAS
ncbi:MAG: pyruvate kinase [Planctomycetota bacterium]